MTAARPQGRWKPTTKPAPSTDEAILAALDRLVRVSERNSEANKKTASIAAIKTDLVSLAIIWVVIALAVSYMALMTTMAAIADTPAGKFFGLSAGDYAIEQVMVSSSAIGATVAEKAKAWAGRDYRPGVKERCAEWIRVVLKEAGIEIPTAVGSAGPLMADSFHAPEQGQMILDPAKLQPGDIVMFSNTYNGGGRFLNGGRITHVGIYVGDGMMVDRPTAFGAVKHRAISTFKFNSALRPHAYGKAVGGGGDGMTQAIALIKEFEGFHPRPYSDFKQCSWGYGTKGPGTPGACGSATITEEQAAAELVAYLDRNCAPLLAPLNLSPGQFAAGASKCYNLGPGQFKGSRTYQAMSRGDIAAAAAGFDDPKWMRAGGKRLEGLAKRRAREKAIFSRG